MHTIELPFNGKSIGPSFISPKYQSSPMVTHANNSPLLVRKKIKREIPLKESGHLEWGPALAPKEVSMKFLKPDQNPNILRLSMY